MIYAKILLQKNTPERSILRVKLAPALHENCYFEISAIPDTQKTSNTMLKLAAHLKKLVFNSNYSSKY